MRISSRSKLSIVFTLFALAAVITALLATGALRGSFTRAHAAGAHTSTKPVFSNFKGITYGLAQGQTGSQPPPPPTDQQCRKTSGLPCYSPQEIRRAYNLDSVLNAGYTGKGQTIVIIDSFGSPTIQSDLKVFDAGFGLPDPPSFKELAPLGKIKYDPTNSDMVGWAAETTLDVEWSHSLAPDANIVLMTSPVDETQGVQGMPEFLFLERFAVQHHLGDIISQSWGTTENTLFTTPGGLQVLKNFETFYQQADGQGVTILGSTGDNGVANPNVSGKLYPFPTVNFPASSPYITAVGGTSLMASVHGQYQSEAGWSGSGGGISQFFAEPAYEQAYLPSSDQQLLNGFRGLPDIAFNADPNTGVLIYLSFKPLTPGWYTIGGTSEGSPSWAGIIADGNQWAGRPLGYIDTALYQIGAGKPGATSYHDITAGNNSSHGIQGYNCGPGWDPVTGWGSPNLFKLLQQLILHT